MRAAAGALAGAAALLDADAVAAAGASRLPPPLAGPSGRPGAPTAPPAAPAGGAPKKANVEWAVRGGVPDLDAQFERLRPRMAHRFPFELDRFQKEAIVHLEQARPWTLTAEPFKRPAWQQRPAA